MDSHPRFTGLQFRKSFIGLDQLLELLWVASEAVVILRHAVDRELTHKEFKALFFEYVLERIDGAVGEVSVRRHIDLLHAVILDEKPADLGELGTEKGFPTRQIQILDSAQLLRQRKNLLNLQIIAPVEIPPIEAMLTCQVTDRVNEQDQEWRRGRMRKCQVLPRQPGMPGYTIEGFHGFMLRGPWLRAHHLPPSHTGSELPSSVLYLIETT
jgi:hypothetical protein